MIDEELRRICADDSEKTLFVTRPKENKSGALSPCNMSCDDVDYEMARGKDR